MEAGDGTSGGSRSRKKSRSKKGSKQKKSGKPKITLSQEMQKKAAKCKITGAGILPVGYVAGKPFFLLGQEKFEKGWSDSGKFSSFAGRREKGETVLQCAAREGYEESMGVLGSQKEILRAINGKKVKGIIKTDCHHTYVYEIPHNPILPELFANVYAYVSDAEKNSKCELGGHGFFEKRAIEWFSPADLWKRRGELRWTFGNPTVLKELIAIVGGDNGGR